MTSFGNRLTTESTGNPATASPWKEVEELSNVCIQGFPAPGVGKKLEPLQFAVMEGIVFFKGAVMASTSAIKTTTDICVMKGAAKPELSKLFNGIKVTALFSNFATQLVYIDEEGKLKVAVEIAKESGLCLDGVSYSVS